MALDRKKLASWQDSTYTRRARYETTEAQSAVRATGYFNAEYKALPKGTILDVVGVIGGTPTLCSYIVTASSSSGVTIALQTLE